MTHVLLSLWEPWRRFAHPLWGQCQGVGWSKVDVNLLPNCYLRNNTRLVWPGRESRRQTLQHGNCGHSVAIWKNSVHISMLYLKYSINLDEHLPCSLPHCQSIRNPTLKSWEAFLAKVFLAVLHSWKPMSFDRRAFPAEKINPKCNPPQKHFK